METPPLIEWTADIDQFDRMGDTLVEATRVCEQLGGLCRFIRKHQGDSQVEAAEHMGIKPHQYGDLESGAKQPSLPEALQMWDYIGQAIRPLHEANYTSSEAAHKMRQILDMSDDPNTTFDMFRHLFESFENYGIHLVPAEDPPMVVDSPDIATYAHDEVTASVTVLPPPPDPEPVRFDTASMIDEALKPVEEPFEEGTPT